MCMDMEFRKDLNWFRTFIAQFNGTCSFVNWGENVDIELFVDASLQGLGGVMPGHFYSVWLLDVYRHRGRIVINEMINILVALRVWGPTRIKDRHIIVWCDNNAVVEVLNRNKTRDKGLGAILRDILMLQAHYNIQIDVRHITGEQNPIADSLSRVHYDKCNECI